MAGNKKESDGLKEAIKHLEEVEGPGFNPGVSSSPGPGLPSHAASDEEKFAEIFQRLKTLEARVRRLETPGS